VRSLRPSIHRLVLLASMLGGILFPVIAAAQSWSTGPSAIPRSDFRPLSRSEDRSASVWRGTQQRAARSVRQSERMPDITRNRAGSRKAVPITRGQGAGVRFRPDERAPVTEPVGSSSLPQGLNDPGFRPIAPRVRMTYEALEAQRWESASPPSPYPGAAATPWTRAPINPWGW
jgi:hypothetical protein